MEFRVIEDSQVAGFVRASKSAAYIRVPFSSPAISVGINHGENATTCGTLINYAEDRRFRSIRI